MHKHEKNTSVARKKKTRDELKRQNKVNTQRRASETKQKQLSWEDIRGLHQECLVMLAMPGRVAPFLRSEEVHSKVSSVAELRRLSEILLKDVQEYKAALQNLEAEWAGRSGAATGPDQFLEAITIGERYHNWVNSYNSVVMPNLLVILDMVNATLPEDQRIK